MGRNGRSKGEASLAVAVFLEEFHRSMSASLFDVRQLRAGPLVLAFNKFLAVLRLNYLGALRLDQ
jgi:hypothetical protein